MKIRTCRDLPWLFRGRELAVSNRDSGDRNRDFALDIEMLFD